MRVLVVHNRYRERGGEDVVFESESELLERHGHHVHRLTFENNAIADPESLGAKARLAVDTVWSHTAAAEVRHAVRGFRPDVAHFHNTFPLASPSVYSAAKREGVPVVQTLHNWRLLCANALFLRDSKACEDCLGRMIPWPALRHRCYRGSLAHTAVLAAMQTVHRAKGTWQKDIDLFIAPTAFTKQKFVQGGMPADRIVVKPHFLDASERFTVRKDPGQYFLFVGRLSAEKGIDTMGAAWGALPFDLRVVGGGELRGLVQGIADHNSHVTWLGPLPRSAVLEQMSGASALIFPSLSYEAGTPLTVLEAFSVGLPVIASRLGSIPEVVQEGHTGLLFSPGDERDLRAKVQWAREHPDELREMGARAHQEYLIKYTEKINYSKLIEIYASVIRNGTEVKERTVHG